MPGARISELEAVLDERALLEAPRRISARVLRATVRLDGAGLSAALPPAAPVELEEIEEGALRFAGMFRVMQALPEVRVQIRLRPLASEPGRLRLELLSVRAGRLPVPLPVARSLLEARAGERPGLVPAEGGLEIDIAEILRPLGIEMPALRSARAADGELELRFQDREEAGV